MQNKADVNGTPVNVPDIEEAVPLGAAILAGIGTGVYQDEDDAFAEVNREGRVYGPDGATHDRYREVYAKFGKLHPGLKEVHGG